MIQELLRVGAVNAIPAEELCEQLHIGKRHLTRCVCKERRAGYPICAMYGNDKGTAGYYLAESQQELLQYFEKLQKRADSILKTIAFCKAENDIKCRKAE